MKIFKLKILEIKSTVLKSTAHSLLGAPPYAGDSDNPRNPRTLVQPRFRTGVPTPSAYTLYAYSFPAWYGDCVFRLASNTSPGRAVVPELRSRIKALAVGRRASVSAATFTSTVAPRLKLPCHGHSCCLRKTARPPVKSGRGP